MFAKFCWIFIYVAVLCLHFGHLMDTNGTTEGISNITWTYTENGVVNNGSAIIGENGGIQNISWHNNPTNESAINLDLNNLVPDMPDGVDISTIGETMKAIHIDPKEFGKHLESNLKNIIALEFTKSISALKNLEKK